MSEATYQLARREWLREKQAAGCFKVRDRTIVYSIGHQDNFEDPEEKVRAELFVDLIENYQYSNDPAVLEMEKRHKIGHPRKKTDAVIDLLIKRDQAPFLMFELKAPDKYEEEMEESIETQLFNVAAVEDKGKGTLRYLVYYTRYWENTDLKEKIVTIDYTKFKSFDAWEEGGRPNLMSIPANYGIVRKPTFIKGGPVDLRTDVKKDELQRIRHDLHNILWGGGKYQNELFFNLIGLLLAKIYDEKETIEGEPYQFQVFQQTGDTQEETESSQEISKRINLIYRDALKRYLGYGEEELGKVKDIVFDAPKVRYVVEVLQDISFTVSKYDVVGEFFEGIVRGEFKQTKGQYLTHTNLINFIIRAMELENLAIELINEENRLPYIIDPACGSGAFLIEAMKAISSHILSNRRLLKKNQAVQDFVRDSFPEHRKNAWADKYVYGIEIHGDLAAATKVNMVGHGDGSANIEAKDALLDFERFSKDLLQVKKTVQYYPKPVNEQFDVVMSNPPFSVTVDRDTAKGFPDCFIQGEDIARRLKKSKELEVATELLFIERWFQLLRPGGRLGVVLPESVFDTTTNRKIRLFLYKYFHIRAVVSLPHLAFAPYTQTKTSLLFAQKKSPAEANEWDELWSKYSQEYANLLSEIDFYFGKDPLCSAAKQLIASYGKKEYVLFDEDDFNDYYNRFDRKLADNMDDGEVLQLLREHLTQYLKASTEEFNEHLLNKVVSRKRSLPDTIAAKIRRISNRPDMISALQQLLGLLFDETDKELPSAELRQKYSEEIALADEDWWVFSKVAQELDYDIFMAHAEEIGYKRGVRREEQRPNDLFTDTPEEGIIIDLDDPSTILDHLSASVTWK